MGAFPSLANSRPTRTRAPARTSRQRLVLDDADLDHAVEAAAFGKFLRQGQICVRHQPYAIALRAIFRADLPAAVGRELCFNRLIKHGCRGGNRCAEYRRP